MKLRRQRQRKPEPAELNITAFMNLMVMLVPFLLITAVFSRMAILQLNVPASSSEPAPPGQSMQLEIVVRRDLIEVGDQRGGLIRSIPNGAEGYDVTALNQLMQEVKARYPDKKDASILLEPEVDYDTLVQVMDAVRVARIDQDGAPVNAELFPDISIGDAPVASASTGNAGAMLNQKRTGS